MPGLLDRAIDRELGPAAGEERPVESHSWLRDWPLLLGLVLSAALIAASTTIGDSPRPPGAVANKGAAAAAASVPGEVVDVGEADPAPAADPSDDAPAASAPAKKKTTKKKTARTGNQAEPAPAAEADAAANDAPARKRTSRTTTPRTPSRSGGSQGSTGGGAKPGKIVNVTGTSAAFSNGPVSYQFSAPTHTPTVGQRWRLNVSATRSGAPLAGRVKIDILHNGSVVGHVVNGKLSGGRFAHDFDWPERSVGYPLTVKTTIVGGGFQQSFLFNVKIKTGG